MSFKDIFNYVKDSKNGQRPFWRKSDLLFVILIFLAALGFFYWNLQEAKSVSPADVQVEIVLDNEVIFSSPLEELPQENFELAEAPGYLFGVEQDKAVKIIKAPCPDGLCMLNAWMKRPGEAAICVPGKLIVRMINADGSAEEDSELDLVIGKADPDSGMK